MGTDEDIERKEIYAAMISSTHHDADNLPYVHKVGVPPTRSMLTDFRSRVKETFFSDDPWRPFKNQTRSRKFILGLQALFPILDWGRDYNLTNLKGDVIAWLTIASLCIPQDIGYSNLANLDPQYGLYSSFVPPVIYAFMGSSRDIAIGPVAVVSLLLGSMLRDEIDPAEHKAEYRRLAFTATFFAGITQATLGFFRLGFLIDFLSHAAIVGFMGGAAVTIALQQLKGFLSIKKFTKKTDIVSVMHSIWGSVHHGDAELPPIIKEEEVGVPLEVDFALQQEPVAVPETEPSVNLNEERALVLYKPVNSPVVMSPSSSPNVSFTVSSQLIRGFKKTQWQEDCE